MDRDEALVRLVEKECIIWKRNDPQFKNIAAKEQAWIRVAFQLGISSESHNQILPFYSCACTHNYNNHHFNFSHVHITITPESNHDFHVNPIIRLRMHTNTNLCACKKMKL